MHRVTDSIGDTLPLEWTLRKRLEEHLSRIWPFGCTEQGSGGLAATRAEEGMNGVGVWGGGRGGAPTGASTVQLKAAVDGIVEITGASAEFAEHALRMSKVSLVLQHVVPSMV